MPERKHFFPGDLNSVTSVNSLKCGTASISDSIFNCDHRLFMLISYCWSLWLSKQSWYWWWRWWWQRWCLWWLRWWQRQSWWWFYFIREGEGAELACIAGGSPQPNITWTRRVRSTILRWYHNIWSTLLRWYHNICDMLSKSSAKHRMDQTGSIIPIKIYINKLDNCMLKEHFISVTSITRKIEKI